GRAGSRPRGGGPVGARPTRRCLPTQAARGVLTAKQAPAGPAPPRRPVCAPGRCRLYPTPDQAGTGERTLSSPSGLRHLRSAPAPGESDRGRRASRRTATHRPKLEVLEDRIVPAFL